MAASDRLIIMDTTGEVPEAKLLQFFMQYVEPAFHGIYIQPRLSVGHNLTSRRALFFF